MKSPKVLLLSDDRESFADGNYYLSYQRAFDRQTRLTVAHPLGPLPDPAQFDLVVLGHAVVEHFSRVRHAGFLPWSIRSRLWFRHAILRKLRRGRTPTVLFTKNDYKHFEVKRSFIGFVRPHLVVTHTKSALVNLIASPRGKLIWLPFGVDAHQFTPPDGDTARPFVVGFRANSNSEWNGGIRERFYRALGRLENKRPVSLTLSKDGEGFLVGKPYVDWIRSCVILGNTVSAAGTVGPRFLEAMACGTVVIAPRDPYEDLLVADKHYIPVDAGDGGAFPGLESAITKFLDDTAYRDGLVDGARALAAEHTVDRHVVHVCRELGV